MHILILAHARTDRIGNLYVNFFRDFLSIFPGNIHNTNRIVSIYALIFIEYS